MLTLVEGAGWPERLSALEGNVAGQIEFVYGVISEDRELGDVREVARRVGAGIGKKGLSNNKKDKCASQK